MGICRQLPSYPWGEVGHAGGISEAVAGQGQGDNLAHPRLPGRAVEGSVELRVGRPGSHGGSVGDKAGVPGLPSTRPGMRHPNGTREKLTLGLGEQMVSSGCPRVRMGGRAGRGHGPGLAVRPGSAQGGALVPARRGCHGPGSGAQSQGAEPAGRPASTAPATWLGGLLRAHVPTSTQHGGAWL